MRRLWQILKAAFSGYLANDALSRGAAIAFYAATSLAPVLLIVVAIAGLVFGQDAARGAISEELGQLLGPAGGDFIKTILERSSDPASGTIATVLGVVTVVITASGVFGEMHTALNATFRAKPIDEPISALIRTRAASLGLVAALGFMLVVSLAASAALSALGHVFQDYSPERSSWPSSTPSSRSPSSRCCSPRSTRCFRTRRYPGASWFWARSSRPCCSQSENR
ncbi:YihY/virulence factor BrkB family protein [Bradyrhizobium japonicum]